MFYRIHFCKSYITCINKNGCIILREMIYLLQEWKLARERKKKDGFLIIPFFVLFCFSLLVKWVQQELIARVDKVCLEGNFQCFHHRSVMKGDLKKVIFHFLKKNLFNIDDCSYLKHSQCFSPWWHRDLLLSVLVPLHWLGGWEGFG